jgi:hypothetical protein
VREQSRCKCGNERHQDDANETHGAVDFSAPIPVPLQC